MTKEEYNKAKDDLKNDYESKLTLLNKKFAFSNSTVKVGDVVTSCSCTIKVDLIKFGFAFGYKEDYPQCYYYGFRLTKNGNPFKSGERGFVAQCDIKKVEAERG